MFVAYWIVCCGHFGLLEGVWGHVRQVLWKGCILECVGGLFDNSLGANNYIYILANKSNCFSVHEA